MVPGAPESVAGGGDGGPGAQDRRREPERAASGRQPAATSSDAWPQTFNDLLGRLEAVDGPAAPVHGRRLARTAHAGGDGADGRQRRAAAAASRRAASIAKRSRSSSSKPPACRASSTTCSRWRAPTPATIRSAGRRCTSMRSSRRWRAARGCSPARRRCRSSTADRPLGRVHRRRGSDPPAAREPAWTTRSGTHRGTPR